MSRHPYQVTTDGGHHAQVIVGWDPPLRTFFAQVRMDDPEDGSGNDAVDDDGGCHDPEIVLWLGCEFDEIYYVADLIEGLGDFGAIPQRIIDDLIADRAADH